MLRNEPLQTFVVPTPERRVKKPRTRGTLNRGRSLDNGKNSSDSDPDSSRQAPAKPPRRKSKNRTHVEERSEPQLKVRAWNLRILNIFEGNFEASKQHRKAI